MCSLMQLHDKSLQMGPSLKEKEGAEEKVR